MTVHPSLAVSARVRQGSKVRGAEALLVPLEGSGTRLPGRPRPSARDGAAGPPSPPARPALRAESPAQPQRGPGQPATRPPSHRGSPWEPSVPARPLPRAHPTGSAAELCAPHSPAASRPASGTQPGTRARTEPECAARGEAGNINRKPLRGLAAPALADLPGPDRSSPRPRVLPARCAGRVHTEELPGPLLQAQTTR